MGLMFYFVVPSFTIGESLNELLGFKITQFSEGTRCKNEEKPLRTMFEFITFIVQKLITWVPLKVRPNFSNTATTTAIKNSAYLTQQGLWAPGLIPCSINLTEEHAVCYHVYFNSTTVNHLKNEIKPHASLSINGRIRPF